MSQNIQKPAQLLSIKKSDKVNNTITQSTKLNSLSQKQDINKQDSNSDSKSKSNDDLKPKKNTSR